MDGRWQFPSCIHCEQHHRPEPPGNRAHHQIPFTLVLSVPDNDPVEIHVTPIGLLAREPIEPSTKLQKQIEISMEPSGTLVCFYPTTVPSSCV